ncbi:MAG TPA: translation initiation factor [Candidatus Nanoarchaeia archaeon]|nr:translation initiation factor [Candidatus Nanoarchaeia archaeon]
MSPGTICPRCGLPQELCVCETIAKESQRITVFMEKKKFGKMSTMVGGIDSKQIDIKEVAKKLKSKFACGGTVKDGVIELQGDHKREVRSELVKLGFSEESIDVE